MNRIAHTLSKASAGDSVLVELSLASSCDRCAKGRGCAGATLFSRQNPAVRVTCIAERVVEEGDEVIVEFGETGSAWLKLVMAAYGLPTLGVVVVPLIVSLCLPLVAGLTAFDVQGASRDLLLTAAAALGLGGGVIAWRLLEPGVLTSIQRSDCLQSGRIVATADSALHLSRLTTHNREN